MIRKQYSKSEIKKLNAEIEKFGLSVNKKDNIIYVEDEYKVIFINREPLFFIYEEKIIPTLKCEIKTPSLKQIVVDMGAVKFVAKGADIMRPGIVEIDPAVEKGEPVAIVDENNKKALGIGIAMYDAEEMKAKEGGKVLMNIHHVTDDLWNIRL